MKVIVPVQFQTSHLLSSNAVETTPAWSAATTYAKGALVDYGTYVYESLVNSNLNKQPDVSPNDWVVLRPDNIHAMFDTEVGTRTTSTSPLNVSVKPGASINSLALLDLQATSVTVQLLDAPSGNVVYSKTVDLNLTLIPDWYAYFFEPYDVLDTAVLTDIPPYGNCVLNISISNDSSPCAIGACLYGNFTDIGDIQYGASFGIRDYSIKETDEFGNTIFVKRAYSKRMEPSVLVRNNRIRYLTKILNEIRATPTVWIGHEDEDYTPLVMFGYYRDYNVDISYPANSLIRFEIEGLI